MPSTTARVRCARVWRNVTPRTRRALTGRGAACARRSDTAGMLARLRQSVRSRLRPTVSTLAHARTMLRCCRDTSAVPPAESMTPIRCHLRRAWQNVCRRAPRRNRHLLGGGKDHARRAERHRGLALAARCRCPPPRGLVAAAAHHGVPRATRFRRRFRRNTPPLPRWIRRRAAAKRRNIQRRQHACGPAAARTSSSAIPDASETSVT